MENSRIVLIESNENKCPYAYQTAISESGKAINPAEFYDEKMEEVDWERFYDECEY